MSDATMDDQFIYYLGLNLWHYSETDVSIFGEDMPSELKSDLVSTGRRPDENTH